MMSRLPNFSGGSHLGTMLILSSKAPISAYSGFTNGADIDIPNGYNHAMSGEGQHAIDEPLVKYKPSKGKKDKFSRLAAIQQAAKRR